MAVLLEDHLPVVKYNGLNTDKAVAMGSTLAVTGAITATGGVVGAVTGAVLGDVTGNVVGGIKSPTVSGIADVVVTAAQSGTTFFATETSGTQLFTLPAVAAGLKYTFVCNHAGGEILIDQAASEVITITTFAAVGADADTAIVTTAGGTGIKNSAGTNAIGDSVTLVSDGTGWFGVGITSGIWASQ